MGDDNIIKEGLEREDLERVERNGKIIGYTIMGIGILFAVLVLLNLV